MKHKLLLLLLGLTCSLWACSDSDKDEMEGTAPVLVSSSPTDGADNVMPGNLIITLTFNQDISFTSADYTHIKLGDADIISAEAGNAKLTIEAENLLEGTSCTLSIPKGLVKGSGDHYNNEDITVSFTTRSIFSGGLLTPCDKNATEPAKKLYTFLHSVYGEKTLAGTMANVDWNYVEAQHVYKLTGKYPAINGFDFISICYDWSNYGDITPVKEWADEGGIVSLMWHFFVPKEEGSSEYTYSPSETTFRAGNIFTSSTWENTFFYEQMDEVCEVLLKIQAEGIPALWRPFHEAAGNYYSGGDAWFWWGYDGPETYVKLWHLMFDYFQSKGIHNLIWTWTTETNDEGYYPGDEYVDIVGRDLYGKGAADNFKEFQQVEADYGHKIVALSECGNSVQDGRIVKSQAFIGEQWNKGCRWLYFMPWYDYNYNTGASSINLMCSDGFWTNAMSRDYVLSRDEVKYILK